MPNVTIRFCYRNLEVAFERVNADYQTVEDKKVGETWLEEQASKVWVSFVTELPPDGHSGIQKNIRQYQETADKVLGERFKYSQLVGSISEIRLFGASALGRARRSQSWQPVRNSEIDTDKGQTFVAYELAVTNQFDSASFRIEGSIGGPKYDGPWTVLRALTETGQEHQEEIRVNAEGIALAFITPSSRAGVQAAFRHYRVSVKYEGPEYDEKNIRVVKSAK